MKYQTKREYVDAEQFLNTQESVDAIEKLLEGTDWRTGEWHINHKVLRIVQKSTDNMYLLHKHTFIWVSSRGSKRIRCAEIFELKYERADK